VSVRLATVPPVPNSSQRKNRQNPPSFDPVLPVPHFTLRDLKPTFEEVQRVRRTSRLLIEEERQLREQLTALIKFLERESRKVYNEKTCAELRGARRMRDRLNGVPGPPKQKADRQLARDWAETRDHSSSAPRRAMPRGGVRRVVAGGSPGLGKRK
jgi:hypothetical protein